MKKGIRKCTASGFLTNASSTYSSVHKGITWDFHFASQNERSIHIA
jgi:hypothetical protein